MLVKDFIDIIKVDSDFNLDRIELCPCNTRYKLGVVNAFPSLDKIDADDVNKSISNIEKQINKLNKRSEGKVLGKFTKPVKIIGFENKSWEDVLSMELSNVEIIHTSEDKYTPTIIYYMHLAGVSQE